MPDPDALLTLEEVADRLHCSRRQVFLLLDRKAFPSVKPGRRRLVRSGDLEAYLHQQLA